VRASLVLLSVLVAFTPGTAHAGRTFYGWLYGSEVMPERGAELQSWVSEHNFENRTETTWLFGAQVGVTDQLEIGLPLEIDWFRFTNEMGMPVAGTVFSRFGIEARYRFVTQDPVDAPALVPLLRVGVKRLIVNRDAFQPEADFVLSYESGIVQVLADIGFVAQVDTDPSDTQYQFRPGLGVSVLAAEDLRFGAEVLAQVPSEGDAWVIAGPNVAWTHGRFWISGAFGVGLIQDRIKHAPRVQWGIAF
jgi:hypothetical protein